MPSNSHEIFETEMLQEEQAKGRMSLKPPVPKLQKRVSYAESKFMLKTKDKFMNKLGLKDYK